jgi:hypothetical protein
MRRCSLEVWQIVFKVHVIKDDLEHGVPTIPNHGKSKKVEVSRLFLTTGIQRRWKSSKRFCCSWTFDHSLLIFPIRTFIVRKFIRLWIEFLGDKRIRSCSICYFSWPWQYVIWHKTTEFNISVLCRQCLLWVFSAENSGSSLLCMNICLICFTSEISLNRWHIYLQFGLFHSALIFYSHVASMTYYWGRG